jgi:hypothetical protein
MFLTSIAIASGTAMAGVKVYRDNKRKKEFPWTVAAEKMERRQPLLYRKKRALPTLNGPVAAINKFKREKINPFVERCSKQLSEISSISDVHETSDAEKEMDRSLAISGASFGLTSVGSWLYPPLSLLSVPGLVHQTSFFFKRSYELIRQEGRVAVAAQLALPLHPFTFHRQEKATMSDSHRLHLISGAKELSLEVNTLDYLPYGTTTLKLRFSPSKDYTKGTLIAAPRQRHADAERVIVGHEDNGNDFWITWGGGKVDGIHFDPSKGQGYLYFNLCHRSTLLKEAYPVTIEVKDKRGNLIAERRFVLKRPRSTQPIRLAWQSDWPAGVKGLARSRSP